MLIIDTPGHHVCLHAPTVTDKRITDIPIPFECYIIINILLIGLTALGSSPLEPILICLRIDKLCGGKRVAMKMIRL